MSISSFWTEYLCYLVFLPAAILCYLPMWNQLRASARKTSLGAGILLCVSIPCLALIDAGWTFGYNTLMVPALAVFLLLYHRTLKTPFCQSLAVFVLVCTLFSFLSNFANAFDAAHNPHGTIDDFSLQAAIFQFVLCAAFSAIAAYPLWKFGSWLIDNFHMRSVWHISCLVSGIFLALNVLMYPRKYETLHTNNVALYYYTALPLMMLLLIFLCVIFYMIVKGLQEMAEMRERNRILEMEEIQYRKQQSYMEESARARHDFRHIIGMLDEMLCAGDIEAAMDYLTDYRIAMPKNEVVRYCNHTALNALLNYYAEAAHQNAVRLRIVIDLPDRVPLSDVDLCNIVGNMLDNAITACCEIPEPKRRIDLTISYPNEARFGIVAANSFNGNVKMDGERYLSTHRGGSGIGLSSITSAAERYGGTASFRHNGEEFISGVVIPLRGE